MGKLIEVCGVKIISVGNVQEVDEYGKPTIVNQVYCQQVNGRAAFSPGDSGAPVYAGRNGSAEAEVYGMLIAGPGNNNSVGFYTPWRYIMAAFPHAAFAP